MVALSRGSAATFPRVIEVSALTRRLENGRGTQEQDGPSFRGTNDYAFDRIRCLYLPPLV